MGDKPYLCLSICFCVYNPNLSTPPAKKHLEWEMWSLEDLSLSLCQIQGKCQSSAGNERDLWVKFIPPILFPQSLKFYIHLGWSFAKHLCRCLFSSKISINMRVYSHYCWLKFHMTLVKMDRKEPLKWSQRRSLVKCVAIWPLYERGGKMGNFLWERLCVSLRCPQNYPGKIQLNCVFQNLRQEKEQHRLVSHL